MKNLLCLLMLIVVALPGVAQEPLYDKIFFENSPMEKNYFYSEAMYTGDSWLLNVSKKIPVNDSVFFTPGNSLQLQYISAEEGSWQASLQYRSIRGQDFFTEPRWLSLRMLIRSKTTAAELPAIAIGKQKDSAMQYLLMGNFVKDVPQNTWIHVRIPLDSFAKISMEDVQQIAFKQNANDGKEHLLFFDQVELVPGYSSKMNSVPQLTGARGYARHVDITWKPCTDTAVKYVQVYRLEEGKFRPVGIQSPFISRYTDYTGVTGQTYQYAIEWLDKNYQPSKRSNTKSAKTVAMTDEQLLDMVQEAHTRYYWEGAEKHSGLALENIHGRREMIATGASGFGMMALLAGAERKFIARDSLVARFEKIVAYLEKADKFHGAFPHFLNGRTGKVEPFFGERDNGADLVETSFLAQGLLAAKQYFNRNNQKEKTLVTKIDSLWRNIEWSWFRKEKNSDFLFWHWSPDKEWIINHKLIGWNETLITYFLAISSPTHAVPASLYYSGWASQSKEAQDYRSGWGQTTDGSMYTNGKKYFGIPLKVGVSNGGPLFFIHYSFLGLKPASFSDAYTNYFENNRNIALINYRYCVENPEKHRGYGPDAWGLTASDGLFQYQADEPVPHQDHGKITPTGALASFPYTPEQSMRALKNYYYQYGKFAWGEYGFYDAFNLNENWRSEIFMGLNQAPIAVMIENYRSGLLWNLFMKNEEVKQAASKIQQQKP